MKIVLAPDPTSPYGEDAFCREVANRAPKRGHETTIASPSNDPRDFVDGADVVLINNFQPAALQAALAVKRRVAVRVTDSFADLPDSELPAIRELLIRADRILVPSRYLARLINSWGGAGKTSLVPYAYDRVRAHEPALITMRASRTVHFQIVTTSKFSESCRPGLEMLLAVVSRLRFDWHLTIVGQGPLSSAIQDQARRMPPPDRISFPGALPHLKIMEFLRAAKAYVVPTSSEGYPAMALYSLSEGCPVIAPKFGAVMELITDGVNGLLFKPEDPLSLCEALVTLASVQGLSLKLIAAGIKTVEHHTWDATVEATFAALEGMLP